MEDLQLAEEAAVLADAEVGANILHANLQQDDSHQNLFSQQMEKPFDETEQAIYDAGPPPYTAADLEADQEHDRYKCPMSVDVPEPKKNVKWQGQYYDIDSLCQLHARQGPTDHKYIQGQNPDGTETEIAIPIFCNPMTNSEITQAEFFGGHRHLSERHWIANFFSRPNPCQHQLLDNDSSDDDIFISQRTGPRGRVNASGNTSITVTQSNNNQSNSNTGWNGNGTRVSTNSNNNPLSQSTSTLKVMPNNMWGNEEIEQAVKNLFIIFRTTNGWENTIARGQRVTRTNANTAQLFSNNGPFQG
jgi:hypothetical protein